MSLNYLSVITLNFGTEFLFKLNIEAKIILSLDFDALLLYIFI